MKHTTAVFGLPMSDDPYKVLPGRIHHNTTRTFPNTVLFDFLKRMGFDPNQVEHVELLCGPNRAVVTVQNVDASGKKFVECPAIMTDAGEVVLDVYAGDVSRSTVTVMFESVKSPAEHVKAAVQYVRDEVSKNEEKS